MASTPLLLRWGIHDCLDEAYVPFFGAFGTARDDAIIARWSANPLAMLWPGGAAFVTSGGGMGPAGHSAAPGGHHRQAGGGRDPPC